MASVPDPSVLGPPGSASGSVCHKFGYGSGSFPFLIKVLSGLKYWLQNKILIQKLSCKKFYFNHQKLIFTIFEAFKFHLIKHKKFARNKFFFILNVIEDLGTDPHPDPLAEVRIRGSGSASGSVPKCHGSVPKCHGSGTLVLACQKMVPHKDIK